MARPVLLVLAGANGAGKSSIGGFLLEQAGSTWFNPDTFAREFRASTGCAQEQANAQAWAEGLRRLDAAIAERRSHAFETTLGGRTIPDRVLAASRTHDVMVWFCGLASADLHVSRVRARVAAGGHDIPEARIRERYDRVLVNLIALMPHLAGLQVYDNSVTVQAGQSVPDPTLVLGMEGGRSKWPSPADPRALAATPPWAKPLVEAALAPR